MKFRAILFVLCLAFFSAAAAAQQKLDADIPAADLLRSMDTDHNGAITREEWDRYFAQHDENKDGVLTREDFLGSDSQRTRTFALDPAVDELFDKLDQDKNGTIARTEWPGSAEFFEHIDADRDGQITREEFRSPNARSWNQLFENIDTNDDGMITRNEWLDTPEAFARLDRDRNGVISVKEFYKRW